MSPDELLNPDQENEVTEMTDRLYLFLVDRRLLITSMRDCHEPTSPRIKLRRLDPYSHPILLTASSQITL